MTDVDALFAEAAKNGTAEGWQDLATYLSLELVKAYRYGERDGYREAVAVFEERFFGGPTKYMVLAWFAEQEPTI